MYVAIQHQLTPGCTHRSVQQLRKAAADYMRANHDEFMPFMDNTENESQFSKYCQEVEQTAAWGGQLEVKCPRAKIDNLWFEETGWLWKNGNQKLIAKQSIMNPPVQFKDMVENLSSSYLPQVRNFTCKFKLKS